MKLQELILIEKVDVNSTQFKAWFGQSKVVDSKGNPLISFRGTTSERSDNKENPKYFRPFQHFGTLTAASKFVPSRQVVGSNTRSRIYPVYLQIIHPLTISDDDGMHAGIRSWMWSIVDAVATPTELRKKVNAMFKQYESEEWPSRHQYTKQLVSLLKKYNIDGLRYINKAEDVGHTTWVILDPKQVKPVYAE